MPASRRLAAILAADVAGYSRLMGVDEEGTLELIHIPHLGLAYAHLFAGRFEEAVLAASRSMQANARFSPPWSCGSPP
jgi:hypothetical protein